jgi:hypothetical protein
VRVAHVAHASDRLEAVDAPCSAVPLTLEVAIEFPAGRLWQDQAEWYDFCQRKPVEWRRQTKE